MPMISARRVLAAAFALTLSTLLTSAALADNYKIDPAHTSVVFHIRHMGISNVAGMFTETGGTFVVDSDPAKMAFNAEIKVDSIFTGQQARDKHLKSPDFFNAKQFQTITFKSTKIEAAGDGYDVTGDLTLHGVTKPVTLHLVKGGEAELPKGTHRFGFTSDLTVKRTDFGMTNMVGMVGDEVKLEISFEGVKQ